MIPKFLSFIGSNNIAIKNTKILLATSGGIDSVVLAHLFNQLEVNFGLAHCNFKLRGKESDEDEKFVRKLAIELGVEVHITTFDTEQVAKSRGVSIQMAARELRYTWFEDIRENHLYDYVATAHHKGDVVETVLFNLSKGAGLEGLHGIRAKRGKLIRPMLFANRIEIQEFAQKESIKWREDSSNKSIKYSRNKIRHQVIPVLEEINPKAQDSIYTTSARINDAESFMHYALKDVFASLIEKKSETSIINVNRLIAIPGCKYVLYEILKTFGFNFSQVESIAVSLTGVSGKLFYSATHVANIDRNTLLISPLTEPQQDSWIQGTEENQVIKGITISTKNIVRENYSIKSSNRILALDKSKLKFPLKIRRWERGDIFYPLGMTGKKKLSDYMIDAKIPVNLKEQILVVISDSKIVGILNHRLDRRFKIDEDTKTVFEITCK
ncbi:MAG: tRNA lysidine(34) synthetase TilS [Cyclobacteriaceae bacterium]|nr:tRNA lysidine(34) synthetase TilS [Cyclobacteriaceae bacterium]